MIVSSGLNDTHFIPTTIPWHIYMKDLCLCGSEEEPFGGRLNQKELLR